jgi:hypothetical protein
MSRGSELRPKKPRNLHATLIAAGVFLVLYVLGAWLAVWSPKRGFGLVFGILATLIFLFEIAYPARRGRAKPLRSAQDWLQAHVYLGALAFLAVLVHAGFRWPSGLMGWLLLLLSLATTVSGLVGVYLQKRIPLRLAEGLTVEALYERIPSLVDKLRGEADDLTSSASDELARFYRSKVRPALARVSRSRRYWWDVRAGREAALEELRRMSQFVAPEEKELLEDLTKIYTEKLELDAHFTLQGLLRSWLWIHVPPAGLLMGLVAIHVFTWVWY